MKLTLGERMKYESLCVNKVIYWKDSTQHAVRILGRLVEKGYAVVYDKGLATARWEPRNHD